MANYLVGFRFLSLVTVRAKEAVESGGIKKFAPFAQPWEKCSENPGENIVEI